MLKQSLRASLAQVGMALREPEEFALRGDREALYQPIVWFALAATAVLGTTVYGMTIGIGSGAGGMLSKSALLSLSAGLAWAMPLPALYILNSLSGSRLRASTTLLAALVTTSWGGLALLASVPIAWFFAVAIPAQAGDLVGPLAAARIVLGIHLLVFTGVSVSMVDVFARVIDVLEPDRAIKPLWYLGLVAVIGAQLFYLFDLFNLSAVM